MKPKYKLRTKIPKQQDFRNREFILIRFIRMGFQFAVSNLYLSGYHPLHELCLQLLLFKYNVFNLLFNLIVIYVYNSIFSVIRIYHIKVSYKNGRRSPLPSDDGAGSHSLTLSYPYYYFSKSLQTYSFFRIDQTFRLLCWMGTM